MFFFSFSFVYYTLSFRKVVSRADSSRLEIRYSSSFHGACKSTHFLQADQSCVWCRPALCQAETERCRCVVCIRAGSVSVF